MASLKIGIAGKPNAGKSTLFSSITGTMVAIGNYAFTTIQPNEGVGFMDTRCPHIDLNKQCNPRHGRCENGVRYVPVLMVDVPGLIEGSSTGKGMGNAFMDSLRDTTAIINLLDPVGEERNILSPEELKEEAEKTEEEIVNWFSSRFSSDWDKLVRKYAQVKVPLEDILLQKGGFFNLKLKDIREILSRHRFPEEIAKWTDEDRKEFSRIVMQDIKPIIRVVNKGDLIEKREDYVKKGFTIISSDYELSLGKAYTAGLISNLTDIIPTEKANEKQRAALEMIRKGYEKGDMIRIFDVISDIIKNKLSRIVVYPVYDESKWTDKDGNVLPDAFIMTRGDTAEDLAFAVHTDIGNGFIRAINGRSKMVIGRTYELQDSDVIRIVARTK